MNSSAAPRLHPLLCLAESAQKAGDGKLVRTALAAAEVSARDNPSINMALMLGYMRAPVSCRDKALSLPPMIQLVTAMYLRKKDGKTEGVSIALVIDENGAAQFPRRGPLVNELQEYCDDGNPPRGNIEYWLPEELAGYRLMHGSVEVQDILPEELGAMSF